ncbi:hypothetical protein BE21_09070 [Sorangium cellulosum]|uniref:Peptidase S1 domain-containing protein n=1 Tax=Sorangium cellulosum TaxID=56 RepID=A0A150U248_SORCE|nr:hypothetical protein BE21_09070 [Sorangium cellulosum]
MNQGSDVAIMVLEAEADGSIEPLDVRALDMHGVGVDEPFYGVGYYFQGDGTTPGARHVAGFTLLATEGHFFKDGFQTEENFEQCSVDARRTPHINARSLDLRLPANYDLNTLYTDGQPGFASVEDAYSQELLPGYQVWLDDGPGGAQPCKGDSGGPLLRRTEDGLAVYGVLSGSVNLGGSEPSRCGFGAVYAIIARETLAWLQEKRDSRR